MAGATADEVVVPGRWRHRYVAANGARFHLAAGVGLDRSRPLAVLLHGFAQFWYAWRHVLPALDERGVGVVAMDMRGYGASDKPPKGYDPPTWAADIAGVVKALGYSRAALIGHDLGGIAAWTAAAYAPQAVRGLAILASPHPLTVPWQRELPGALLDQLPMVAERRLLAEAGRYRRALVDWPSAPRALAHRRHWTRAVLSPAGASYRAALRSGVFVPVLSLRGTADPLVDRGPMAAAGRYVHARHDLVELAGVGHLPHEEAPAAISDALTRWLDTLDQDD